MWICTLYSLHIRLRINLPTKSKKTAFNQETTDGDDFKKKIYSKTNEQVIFYPVLTEKSPC